jgi:hypothetical protein
MAVVSRINVLKFQMTRLGDKKSNKPNTGYSMIRHIVRPPIECWKLVLIGLTLKVLRNISFQAHMA